MASIATLLRKARRARQLSVRDWWSLGRAVPLVVVVHLALRIAGYATVRRALDLGCRSRGAGPPREELERLSTVVDIAARNLPGAVRCLTRTLALYRMVRCAGAASEVRIGVRKGKENRVEAHAWLEVDGEILGDQPDVATEFAVLERWPERVERWAEGRG